MRKLLTVLLAAFVLAASGLVVAGPFVDGNTPLPGSKVDRFAPTDPTRQWTASDANFVFNALGDLRTAATRGIANVKGFGAKGDGAADDTAAIQAALDATQGITLYFPRGKYKVTSTLTITTTSHHLVGDYANRNTGDMGTQILYMGTGPCIQIGTDNGHDWSTGDYDGPQGQMFERLTITHGAPDTALVSANQGSTPIYKAGSYGIWDWRGGQIVLRDMWIERFEANFVGVNSDLDYIDTLVSLYSKFGVYFGPRSDQAIIKGLYSFSNDRAATLDGANNVTFEQAKIVGCGTSTVSAVEIRLGTNGVTFDQSWFERVGLGYQGTDQPSFVSCGEVSGYGSGGSIQSPGGSPTTTPVNGALINDATVGTTLTGVAGHTVAVATLGKCLTFGLRAPAPMRGTALTNFDEMILVPAAQSPTNAEASAFISGIASSTALSKIFVNSGGGSPQYTVTTTGSSGAITYASAAMTLTSVSGVVVPSPGLTANSTTVAVSGTNSVSGQTASSTAAVRGLQSGTYDTTAGGLTSVGMLGQAIATRSAGANTLSNVGGQFTASGGQSNIAIQTLDGDVQLNSTSGAARMLRSVRFSNEVAPSALAANQDNYSPTGFGDAFALLLSASTPINITGFAANSQTGRAIWVYNQGTNNITLVNNSASSTSTNRITGIGNADVVLTAGHGVWLYYSPSALKWIVMGSP